LTNNTDDTKLAAARMNHAFLDALFVNLLHRFPKDDTKISTELDKVLNPKQFPVKAADLKGNGEKYFKVLINHFEVSRSKNVSGNVHPMVKPTELTREWRDCSLMNFCKLNLYTSLHRTIFKFCETGTICTCDTRYKCRM